MAREGRPGRRPRRNGEEIPQVKVKALKLKGRSYFVLRWINPATGKAKEEVTEIPVVSPQGQPLSHLALEKNRRKAIQLAAKREAELQDRLDSGVPLTPPPKPRGITVRCLVDNHLAWVEINRSTALHKQRKCLLNAFCVHLVTDDLAGAGERIEAILAPVVDIPHVEQYLSKRTTERRPIVVAIKAAWNWAADNGVVAKSHRPMSSLARGKTPPRDLSEADLPTDAEIEAIFRWASVETSKVRAGTGRWRKRRPDEYYDSADARVFADLLRVYHATGARTSELCDAQVRDFMPSTKQLCLGRHKRTTTQRNPTIRNIQLGKEALQIVKRNIAGKAPHEPLFGRRDGTAWNQNDVNRRFRGVREIAGAHDQKIRPHITPYSFRHLYISELLTLGEPTWKVAKMAGTSVTEIERTYGHFFNRDLADAQHKLDQRRAVAKLGESVGESHPKSVDN